MVSRARDDKLGHSSTSDEFEGIYKFYESRVKDHVHLGIHFFNVSTSAQNCGLVVMLWQQYEYWYIILLIFN